jgi:BMFP domain-containing protein YqiC
MRRHRSPELLQINANNNHELLMNRIDLLRTETEAHFRKQGHVIRALNDVLLEIRGDHRELFERIAALEEKAP